MHACEQVSFESRQEVLVELGISDSISLRSRITINPSRIPSRLRDRLVIAPPSLPPPPPSLLASTATPPSRAASCARENLRTLNDDRIALIAGAVDDRVTFHHEMTRHALLFISKLQSSGCLVLSSTIPVLSRSLSPVPVFLFLKI